MRLYYKDPLGRQVFCTVVERGDKVLFVDSSHEHGGMSITNSVEGAIDAYRAELGNGVEFYEVYRNLPDSFSQVDYPEGQRSASWKNPGDEARQVFGDYLA